MDNPPEDRGPRVPDQDRKDLQAAINVFGEDVIARAIAKTPSIKDKACEEIRVKLANYSESESEFKPGMMLRGSSQIAARLIRDKVWTVFSHGIAITNTLLGHFVFAHPSPKKELSAAVMRIQKELTQRGNDNNERVLDKAEAAFFAMLENDKISSIEAFQEEILKPLGSGTKQNPKTAFFRAQMIKFIVTDQPHLLCTGLITNAKVAAFGLSAVEHTSSSVRRLGEQILVKLYELDPKPVRRVLPPDNPMTRRKNHNFKYLFEAFERRDRRSPSPRPDQE